MIFADLVPGDALFVDANIRHASRAWDDGLPPHYPWPQIATVADINGCFALRTPVGG